MLLTQKSIQVHLSSLSGLNFALSHTLSFAAEVGQYTVQSFVINKQFLPSHVIVKHARVASQPAGWIAFTHTSWGDCAVISLKKKIISTNNKEKELTWGPNDAYCCLSPIPVHCSPLAVCWHGSIVGVGIDGVMVNSYGKGRREGGWCSVRFG